MTRTDYLPLADLNGSLLETTGLGVSPLNGGFMLGHGLFETIKVAAGKPLFLNDHFARMDRAARALGLAFSGGEPLAGRCRAVVKANKLGQGNLKVVLFADEGRASELIVARPNAYGREDYERGFRLRTRVEDRSPSGLQRFKTLNYLANILALRGAKAAGFDDALFLSTSNLVLEGAITTVFAVERGSVVTPPLSLGLLPGVARGNVFNLLGEGAREESLTRERLLAADEVFVTNALLGVMPVSRIDAQDYSLKVDSVTERLRVQYTAFEERSGF
jgi:branched-subunit amino acid aminotransferase/4-amino-4-deoxychorismate lyase